MARSKAIRPDEVGPQLADMRRRLAELGRPDAVALVDRAEALAREGRVAQASELLRQAAESLSAD